MGSQRRSQSVLSSSLVAGPTVPECADCRSEAGENRGALAGRRRDRRLHRIHRVFHALDNVRDEAIRPFDLNRRQ